MKLTTDYERNKSVLHNKQNNFLKECFCQEFAKRILLFGHLALNNEETQKLNKKNFFAVRKSQDSCTHQILIAVILTLDKANVLSTLHAYNFPLENMDENSRSILHNAVAQQAINCIYEILQMFKNESVQWILKKDKHNVTPLHLAAQWECPKILKLFLNELANAACDIFQETHNEHKQSPLHYAAAVGSLSACEMLLSNEKTYFPLDQRDIFGQTPLMYAVGCKFAEEVIRLLASKKKTAITMRNKRGMSALHIAVLTDNILALNILLHELNADPTAFDNNNRTPLHYAALYGRKEAAKTLLLAGANNETRDIHNVTPAHYAAQAGGFETFNTILQQYDVVDNENRTCFMWAIIAQCEETVQKMLQSTSFCITKSHRDKYQYTALHLAALTGNKNICRMLVDYGFDITERDVYDATPEHLAASEGHIDALTVFAFKRGGSKTTPLDCLGRPPFFYACLSGQAHAVRRMLEEQRSNIDRAKVDAVGYSAIHCAVIAGSLQTVELLLHHNFDPNIVDKDGRTAMQLATESEKIEIKNFLANYTNQKTKIQHTLVEKK